MKFTKQISAGLLSLGLLAGAQAQQNSAPKFELPQVGGQPAASAATAPATPAPAATAAPTAPAAPAKKYSESEILETFGYSFALQSGLFARVRALEFTPAQVEAIVKGLGLALQAKQIGYNAQEIMPQVEQYLQDKEQAFLTKLRDKNLQESAAFFAKLKENKAVVELPSGLRYEIVKLGSGAKPKAGQLAKIHYTGSFVSGQVFDSSLQQTQEGVAPQPVPLLVQDATQETPNGTISGLVEGLQKIGVGTKAKFYVPPHLAYGDAGVPQIGIPPGATLVFEVELFEVTDAPKPAPAK